MKTYFDHQCGKYITLVIAGDVREEFAARTRTESRNLAILALAGLKVFVE